VLFEESWTSCFCGTCSDSRAGHEQQTPGLERTRPHLVRDTARLWGVMEE
jgi:hypothetical protein